MANIETLKTRVENTTKKITKLEQKLERINEALNGGKNPYYYEERDLRITTRELETTKEALKKYEEQLAIEINKENAPKIKVLVDFLETWKEKARTFYRNECLAYYEMYNKHKAEEEEFMKDHGYNEWYRSETRKQQRREMEERFTNLVKELHSFRSETHTKEELLEKMLIKEVKAKYEDLVNRISKVTGEIKDCNYLYIGDNGSINGYVIGEKAKANVETIMAGGYNIQCLHYRVLVKKIK